MTYTRSLVTLLNGASIIRTAQVESQFQPPDLGVMLATLMDTPLPLAGPIHPGLLKGKVNYLAPKVKAEKERTVMVTGVRGLV